MYLCYIAAINMYHMNIIYSHLDIYDAQNALKLYCVLPRFVHALTPFVLSLFISLNEYSEQPSDKSYKYISVHAIISAIKDFLANNTYFVP